MSFVSLGYNGQLRTWLNARLLIWYHSFVKSPVGGNSQVRVFCVFQARSTTNTDFIHGQLVDETNNQYSQNT